MRGLLVYGWSTFWDGVGRAPTARLTNITMRITSSQGPPTIARPVKNIRDSLSTLARKS
jgi:hypothetical protein